MTTISIKKKKAGIAPAGPDDGHRWSHLNRDLKPHEDLVRMLNDAGTAYHYGVVTGGFGCNMSGMGHAVFVEETQNIEDALVLRDEHRVNGGKSDIRALPPNRFQSTRWQNYDIDGVMIDDTS